MIAGELLVAYRFSSTKPLVDQGRALLEAPRVKHSIPASTLHVFEASLNRCTHDAAFLERFYDRFLASSPDVAAKFRGVDMGRQRNMLKSSLYLLSYAAKDQENGLSALEGLATRHGRHQRNVRPELYDLWLTALMATVRDFDIEFNETIDRAWREVMLVGITFIRSRY